MAKRKTEEPAVANDNPVYVETAEPQSALYTAVEVIAERVGRKSFYHGHQVDVQPDAIDLFPDSSGGVRVVMSVRLPLSFADRIIKK